MVEYLVQVLSQKRKFNNGLILRKVRVTRKVYRKKNPTTNTEDGGDQQEGADG